MKQIHTFAFAVALITAYFANTHHALAQSNLKPAELESKVDALVAQYQDLDIFSGVVLIAEKGEPLYHKAFGLADRERKIKNTLNTKFDIGSMNKTFTKVVILQLVEEGKLQLSDQMSRYLPAFSDPIFAQISIEHLLNHRAGFGDYFMTPGFFDLPLREKDISSLVERIRMMPLHFEAGTEEMYSNSGYILLGAIIEKITGKSYHDNVQKRIIEPLGLDETYVYDKTNVPNKSIGYLKNMRGEIEDNSEFQELPNPDGGFQSTARDVMTFYRAFYYGELLLKEKTKALDEFYRFTQTHKTTGAAIPTAGGFNGANSVHIEILRDDISITVLANMDEPVAEQLGFGILAIVRGQEPDKATLPAIQNVFQSYQKHGLAYVKANFESLTVNFHPTDPKSIILNAIGYEYLFEEQVDKALEIFQLNTDMFPQDPNVWDSLAEAYLTKGDSKKALQYYQKALDIDPEFPSAKEAVKKLKKK